MDELPSASSEGSEALDVDFDFEDIDNMELDAMLAMLARGV